MLLADKLKSVADAVGLPVVRICTGIVIPPVGAADPKVAVTVSVPPSVTAPLLFTSKVTTLEGSMPTVNTGERAYNDNSVAREALPPLSGFCPPLESLSLPVPTLPLTPSWLLERAVPLLLVPVQ